MDTHLNYVSFQLIEGLNQNIQLFGKNPKIYLKSVLQSVQSAGGLTWSIVFM